MSDQVPGKASNITWSSVTAIILAVGVSIALIILVLDEYTHSGHLTSDEANTITAIMSAIIGALAVYLGGRRESDHT